MRKRPHRNQDKGSGLSSCTCSLCHHTIVLCVAACCAKCVPQDTPGVYSAREFVWWYNGHPDARNLPIDLTKARAGTALQWAVWLCACVSVVHPCVAAGHALYTCILYINVRYEGWRNGRILEFEPNVARSGDAVSCWQCTGAQRRTHLDHALFKVVATRSPGARYTCMHVGRPLHGIAWPRCTA